MISCMGNSWTRCLLAGCAVLASWAGSAAAAQAARRSPQVNVVMTGSLTIGWTAGAGRGCAGAGLCGVSGSLEMLAGGSASASGGPAPFELSDFNAAVRVITRAGDGSVRSTCADLLPVDVTLTVRHTARGLRAVLGRQFFQPPS